MNEKVRTTTQVEREKEMTISTLQSLIDTSAREIVVYETYIKLRKESIEELQAKIDSLTVKPKRYEIRIWCRKGDNFGPRPLEADEEHSTLDEGIELAYSQTKNDWQRIEIKDTQYNHIVFNYDGTLSHE